jgi:hypothetical protein
MATMSAKRLMEVRLENANRALLRLYRCTEGYDEMSKVGALHQIVADAMKEDERLLTYKPKRPK